MKYDALKLFLLARTQQRLRLSFQQVAVAAKVRLPASAFHHPAWWANDSKSHAQSKAWLEAGYKTENVDITAQSVEFVRVEAQGRGVSEMPEAFEPAAGELEQHPLVGWMKGTFTIASDWDLTKPSLDPHELAEMEANLDRLADMVDERRRKRK
ncbi:MAG: hypothetical protein QM759_11110 [Terricaulis sp.]